MLLWNSFQMPSRMPDLPTASPVRICLFFVSLVFCDLTWENPCEPVTLHQKRPAGKFFYSVIPLNSNPPQETINFQALCVRMRILALR